MAPAVAGLVLLGMYRAVVALGTHQPVVAAAADGVLGTRQAAAVVAVVVVLGMHQAVDFDKHSHSK